MSGRFDRSGDIMQFLKVLDSATPEKQHEILSSMQSSDPARAALIKARLLSVERILSLDVDSLSRVLEDVDDKVFGLSLHGVDLELRKRAIDVVNGEKRKSALQILKQNSFNQESIDSAKRMLVQRARDLEIKGRISLGSLMKRSRSGGSNGAAA